VRIPTECTGLLDTCGTGGDGLGTFNISTATAIVTAACGIPVAKHANRSFSSRSGSADVLEALGVRVDLTPEEVGRSIRQTGLGFCFAPVAHGALKFAAPVRKRLGFRTVFNLLGPLANPAGAPFQLIGVNRIELAQKMASAIARLGTRRTLVVCGNDELDEVSLWGPTTVFQVEHQSITRREWSADALGLAACRVDDVRVSSAAESARIIREVLAGVTGPARDIVLANAAAALIAADGTADPQEAVARAAGAIDGGKAAKQLAELVAFAPCS
jgi:anthranilate phosphoribosyltransferase